VSEEAENQISVDQICLLDRSGVLQVCFEDTPLIFGTLAAATFSWSADSSRFYFVADYGDGDKRLIEADVTTGQTLLTIYQFSTDVSHRTQTLSWSSTLDHVIINPGLFARRNLPRLLVNLENNEALDINALMPKSTQLVELCPQFSPHDTFLTATIRTEDSDQALIVFDKQGHIVHIIDETSGFGAIHPLCPVTWGKNETVFYFYAEIMSSRDCVIFRYSLESETLEVFYNMGADRFSKESIYGPYVLSPAETHIAGITSPQSAVPQVVVLYPTGKVEYFSEPYSFGVQPVWIPPTTAQ
jgi:hypothetical protein